MQVQGISTINYNSKNFGARAKVVHTVVTKISVKSAIESIPKDVKSFWRDVLKLFKKSKPKQVDVKRLGKRAEQIAKKYSDKTLLDAKGNSKGQLWDVLVEQISAMGPRIEQSRRTQKGIRIARYKELGVPEIIAKIPIKPIYATNQAGTCCLSPGGVRLIYADGAVVTPGPMGYGIKIPPNPKVGLLGGHASWMPPKGSMEIEDVYPSFLEFSSMVESGKFKTGKI